MAATAATSVPVTTTNDYKCKVCFECFASIREVFRHELSHMVNGGESETGTKRLLPSNSAVRNRNKRAKRFQNQKVDDSVLGMQDELRHSLLNCREGTELNILCRLFQSDPTLLSQMYNRIVADLQCTLESDQVAGSWEVHAFGSTITGMAFQNSDIDFYICPQYRNLPFRQQFNRVNKSLIQSQLFTNIVPIRNARVPILKCVHINTGIHLDINMSSCFGVFNSRFIAKLFLFDQRIHPLMLVIKIWAKSWSITKTGRMTNYSLILLVVFYLQNCPNPILPPLKVFLNNVRPEICEGVNFAFNTKIANRTRNCQNIKELMAGFFKFYADFDFSQNIVCTYLGKPLNRFAFQEGTVLFPECDKQLDVMQQLIERSTNDPDNNLWNRDISGEPLDCTASVIVQDPFCFNNNTTKILKGQLFQLFRRQIAHGWRITQNPNNKASQMLLRLFYEVSPEHDAPPAPVIAGNTGNNSVSSTLLPPPATTSTKNKQAGVFTCRLNPVENEMFFVRMFLRKEAKDKILEKIDVDRFWCKKLIKFLERTLIEIYRMKLTRKASIGPNNAFTLNGELESYADTWQNRKCDTKKGYAHLLKEQRQFGELIAEQRKKSERVIHCAINIIAERQDYSAVNLTMRLLTPTTKNNLAIFFNDLTDRLRIFMKACFEEMAMSADMSESEN